MVREEDSVVESVAIGLMHFSKVLRKQKVSGFENERGKRCFQR